MSNIPKDLPERIKYLREQKEMSQSDLAKRIGIDSSRLSRIENGEIQKVSDDVVLAIAQIFEVSTDFLLGVTDDPCRQIFISMSSDYPSMPQRKFTAVKLMLIF